MRWRFQSFVHFIRYFNCKFSVWSGSPFSISIYFIICSLSIFKLIKLLRIVFLKKCLNKLRWLKYSIFNNLVQKFGYLLHPSRYPFLIISIKFSFRFKWRNIPTRKIYCQYIFQPINILTFSYHFIWRKICWNCNLHLIPCADSKDKSSYWSNLGS